MRRWIFGILAIGLVISAPIVWFRQPLLVKMGRWLLVDRPQQKADLVIALGGDRRRQEAAAQLLHQGAAPWILFLGPDVRRQDYHCLDVPVDRIALPSNPAHTTYEEAQTTRLVVEEHRFKSVLIVTSPYHERRALWVFTKVFEGTGVVLGITTSTEEIFPTDAWWKSYIWRKMVVMEYLGLGYYWLTVR